MSRIHEALKKAAEERRAQLATGGEQALIDIAEVTKPTPALSEAEEAKVRVPVGPERVAPLSYEDLIRKCAKPKWRMDARMNVFESGGDSHVGAERFRTLRSRLYQIASTRPLKRVVVTSSLPAEGKTFVTANLGQSIVRQPDRRVLVIDADLRASRLHEVFGAPRTPGLSDYLKGEADEFQVVQTGTDANLCFIAGGSGVTNPSELLLNERMKQLLDLMTPLFDWILLDTPPALPVHDASMMADLCDGVLFVVQAGVTDHEVAAKAAAEFEAKNLLGVVLNRAAENSGYGAYYYHYPSISKKD